MRFKEFMSEPHNTTRWTIARSFIIGMLCGSALAVTFLWIAAII